MLQAQNIALSFAGVDTKTDPKLVVPGKCLFLVNGRYTTTGAVSKRPGYLDQGRSVLGGTTLSSSVACAGYGTEVLLADGTNLYSFSQANTAFSNKGVLLSPLVAANPVVRSSTNQANPAAAIHSNGLQGVIWEDSSGTHDVRYSIVDTSTGQVLVNNALVTGTGQMPQVFALGVYLVFFYVDTSSHNLVRFAVNVNDPATTPTPTNFVTDLNTSNPRYDVRSVNENKGFIAYNNNSNQPACAAMNLGLVLNGPVNSGGTMTDGSITIFPEADLNSLIICYGTTTPAIRSWTVAASNLTTLVSDRSLGTPSVKPWHISGIATSQGNYSLYWTQTPSGTAPSTTTAKNCFIQQCTFTPSTASSITTFKRSVSLAGDPFLYNTTVYVPVAHTSAIQNSYFLLDQNGNNVSKFLADVGGGIGGINAIPNLMQQGTVYSWAFLQRDLLTTDVTLFNTTGIVTPSPVYTQNGVTISSADMGNPAQSWSRASIAQSTFFGGGSLRQYSGDAPVEQGFSLFPEDLSASQASGTDLPAGVYYYFATYEWVSATTGLLERSCPSPALKVTVTGSSDGNVTITIPTLRISAKQNLSPVSIVVYRTTAGGSEPFRVTSVTSPILNDPTTDTKTYGPDTISDTSLQAGVPLYTWGNVLENIQAPPSAAMTTYNNRLILLDAEDRLNLWVSKEVKPGQPVEFNDTTTVRCDPRGGDVTALWNLDAALVIFKNTSVFGVTSQLYDDAGNLVDNPSTTLITTDSGCTEPRSLVTVPMGCIYKSAKGFMLLDRGLNATYIGADVEAFNGFAVTSAVLLSKQNQVRFTLAGNNTCLVWDYFRKEWQWDVGVNAVDAVSIGNDFYYARPDGHLYKEDANTFTDGGAVYKRYFQTSWLKFAQIGGFQRVWHAIINGTYLSPHQLRIGAAWDYQPVSQWVTVDATSLFGSDTYGTSTTYGSDPVYGGTNTPYELRLNFAQQKGEAVSIYIEDVPDITNPGATMNLTSITFHMGIKQGLKKLPANKVVG